MYIFLLKSTWAVIIMIILIIISIILLSKIYFSFELPNIVENIIIAVTILLMMIFVIGIFYMFNNKEIYYEYDTVSTVKGEIDNSYDIDAMADYYNAKVVTHTIYYSLDSQNMPIYENYDAEDRRRIEHYKFLFIDDWVLHDYKYVLRKKSTDKFRKEQ